MNNRFDLTHNLENIVYNDLVFMGYERYVYNNNSKEIDFLATKDNKQYYIQVAYSAEEEKAYEREMGAFKNIDNLSQIIAEKVNISTGIVIENTKRIQYNN